MIENNKLTTEKMTFADLEDLRMFLIAGWSRAKDNDQEFLSEVEKHLDLLSNKGEE